MQSDPGLLYQQLVAAVSRDNPTAQDWYRLGCALHDNKRWAAAAACFARAHDLDPNDHKILTNLGWNLHMSGRSEVAVSKLDAAIVASGDREALPHALLSQVFGTGGENAAAHYHGLRAVELDPTVPVNHVALAFALAGVGDWRRAWQEYEHRFAYKIPEFLTRPYRLWRGEKVGHLYLEAEQGLGDSIMALRWLSQAAERAERVTLFVQRELYPLIATVRDLPTNLTTYPMPRSLPSDVDAWCPLMSLPAALDLGGPENEGVYLPNVSYRALRDEEDEITRVGIVWAGSTAHEQAHHRDCPLIYWMRLAEIPNSELHSLQVGEATNQLSEVAAYGLVRDRGPEITNLLDTARIIAGLDLVIAVDTSVAHLAGAMGVPCWVLANTRGADFRWSRGEETTGWYPSFKFFWRSLDEQWTDVMRRVDRALRNMG